MVAEQIAKYPEHEKLTKVKEKSQWLGEFIAWAQGQGLSLCEHIECTENHVFDKWHPRHESIENLLARFLEVDLKILDEEKQQMLIVIRNKNNLEEKRK